MVAVRQDEQEMIQNLPDNCTYKDIHSHLYVVAIVHGKRLLENHQQSITKQSGQ